MSQSCECGCEASGVEFTQVMGLEGGALSSPLTLPAGSGIKSAPALYQTTAWQLFPMTRGKTHWFTSSVGLIWEEMECGQNTLYERWDVDSRKRSAVKRRMERKSCFKWHLQYFSRKWILTFSTMGVEPWCWLEISLLRIRKNTQTVYLVKIHFNLKSQLFVLLYSVLTGCWCMKYETQCRDLFVSAFILNLTHQTDSYIYLLQRYFTIPSWKETFEIVFRGSTFKKKNSRRWLDNSLFDTLITDQSSSHSMT